jgi:hypothetical protein
MQRAPSCSARWCERCIQRRLRHHVGRERTVVARAREDRRDVDDARTRLQVRRDGATHVPDQSEDVGDGLATVSVSLARRRAAPRPRLARQRHDRRAAASQTGRAGVVDQDVEPAELAWTTRSTPSRVPARDPTRRTAAATPRHRATAAERLLDPRQRRLESWRACGRPSTTRAPSSRQRRTIVSPRLPSAPVTSTTLPASRPLRACVAVACSLVDIGTPRNSSRDRPAGARDASRRRRIGITTNPV